MKILHTSDWHLGRSLYGRNRYDEFAAFLDWLVQTLEDQQVDALLVAGDVFDTSTPSNRAQQLYYGFLYRVAASCCRHVVIIAGNHDSPSFLNAPRELLRALNVHVVAAKTDDPADEVIVLRNHAQVSRQVAAADRVEAILCAVPYLRDRDIRTAEPGETIDDKNRKLVEGLKGHYASRVQYAQALREDLQGVANGRIPLIGMGHLFTAGGQMVEGDGVRELYVGSLVQVGVDAFPASLDYLALGHLHVPQVVGGAEHIRYCGSPIPMGFGEARQRKKVLIVEFDSQGARMHADAGLEMHAGAQGQALRIRELGVPCFQQLVRVVGSLDEIRARLDALKAEHSSAWLEIEYSGRDVVGNLRELLDELVAGSDMEIRRVKNQRVMDRMISAVADEETLDDLDVGDVFARCLDAFEVPQEDREELTACHDEIVKSLAEDDGNAE